MEILLIGAQGSGKGSSFPGCAGYLAHPFVKWMVLVVSSSFVSPLSFFQHGLLLAFQIRLLWLENAIRATVLAMILGISTTIGTIGVMLQETMTHVCRVCERTHIVKNGTSSLTI